jgi:hypothetical protein
MTIEGERDQARGAEAMRTALTHCVQVAAQTALAIVPNIISPGASFLTPKKSAHPALCPVEHRLADYKQTVKPYKID